MYQLRQTEQGESQHNVEKIVARKETHQLMKISLEFLPVEYNDRETVANQPEGCNQRLKILFKKMKKLNSDFTIRIPSTIRLNIRAIINSKSSNNCIVPRTCSKRLDRGSTVQHTICSSWILSLSLNKKNGELSINQKLTRNTFYTSIPNIFFFTASIWLW